MKKERCLFFLLSLFSGNYKTIYIAFNIENNNIIYLLIVIYIERVNSAYTLPSVNTGGRVNTECGVNTAVKCRWNHLYDLLPIVPLEPYCLFTSQIDTFIYKSLSQVPRGDVYAKRKAAKVQLLRWQQKSKERDSQN